MTKVPIDVDETLKKLASESVKQGDYLGGTVCNVTPKVLQGRTCETRALC